MARDAAQAAEAEHGRIRGSGAIASDTDTLSALSGGGLKAKLANLGMTVTGLDPLAAALGAQDQQQGWSEKMGVDIGNNIRQGFGMEPVRVHPAGNPLSLLRGSGEGAALAAAAVGKGKGAATAAKAVKLAAQHPVAVEQVAKQTGRALSPRAQSLADYGKPVEEDIVRSLENAYKGGQEIPHKVLDKATARRAKLREEPSAAGKPFSQLSDEERMAFGAKHGVDMTANPMEKVIDQGTGREFLIPGGMKKPLTIVDMHQLQAQGYNPKDMSPEFHRELHKLIVGAATPKDLTDAHVHRGINFGLLSPNSPLLPNEMMVARMHPRTPEEMDKLASYTRGKTLTKSQRAKLNKQMGVDYGVEKSALGGLGMRQSPDMTNLSEFADKFMQNPEFFRKQGDETWKQTAERVGNELRGLGAKTASMGVVWQDAAGADISAMDRHMARNFRPFVINHPDIGPKFKSSAVTRWNQGVGKDPKKMKALGMPKDATPVKDWDDLVARKGGVDFTEAQIETQVNAGPRVKVKGKGGLLNQKVPEHLRDLPSDPSHVQGFGPMYDAMIGENAKSAAENNRSVFAEQWGIWDPIRERVSTHPSMHPDASKLPRMGAGELLDAFTELKGAGFGGKGKVRPYDWKKGTFWGLPAAAGAGGLLTRDRGKAQD